MHTVGEFMREQNPENRESAETWSSDAETVLALEMRARGWTVRRQVRFGRYVVDILICEGRVAVEVDGKQFHNWHADYVRDQYLHVNHGVRTIRVAAADASQRTEDTVSKIAAKLLMDGYPSPQRS